MRTPAAASDHRPRTDWASVFRDVPKALALIGVVLAGLLFAGLMP
ncbi:hypothetical protein ACE7GA_16240 [Roseomonas sp. CCTCC AB2023176]